MRNVPGDAEVNHPVHHVEADEHDGEDNSAVLVNITAPHAEYSVGRFGWRQGGQGQLDWLGVPVPDVVVAGVPGQRVVTPSDRAGHHAARVELQLRLK